MNMEPINEKLEKEIEKQWNLCETIDEGMGCEYANIPIEQFDDICRHFAEWQRKQDQETIELAEDHAMLAGMMKEREEMIKDAINAEVLTNFYYRYLLPEVSTSIFDSFKTGDKVKIIVIKKDDQSI